jgi:TRAP-type uncharacterized transport system substrate-binding protein
MGIDTPPASDSNFREGPIEPGAGPETESEDDAGAPGFSGAVRPRVKYWVTLSGIVVPALLVVLFVILWFVQRWIPKSIVVATAWEDSSYHVFGKDFCEALNRHLESESARVQPTVGSPDNVEKLTRNRDRVHLGMYQGGTGEMQDMQDIVAVAPLYREVVHVLVKKEVLDDAKYRERELTGDLLRDLLVVDRKQVYAGPEYSGMRLSAQEILEHYGMKAADVRFAEEETPGVVVVISTTGMCSKKLQNRVEMHNYQYLSLDSDAIADRHAHFATHKIPKASYRDENGKPVPNREVRTVATTAFLIVHRNASSRLVTAALEVLYQGELSREQPRLIPLAEATDYLHGMPVHETARAFFNPYDLGYLASVIESLAGTKELIVAFGAGLYLVWTLRRRREDTQRHAEMEANRVRLSSFVDRTVAIESAQIGVSDPARLAEYLEEVTRIKLEALDELTDAELRGDRTFSIFLMQCANLISKIQLKIVTYAPNSPPGEAT